MKIIYNNLIAFEMKNLLLLLILLLILTGCCRKVIPVRSEKSDSMRVENRTEYIERIRWDTLKIEVPAQSAVYTGPADSSFLETDYASSVARILDDGSLYHDLYNKPQKQPVIVPVVNTEHNRNRDSIVIRNLYTEVPVRMPLRWWEESLVWIGAVALGGLVITGIYYVLRKRILKH